MYDFLVIGHPRSATGYMAQLFQFHGYDVTHEKLGKNGISSWMFAVYGRNVPFTFDGSAHKGNCWKNIIHIVRDPLKTISSVVFTESASLAWRRQFVLIKKDSSPIEQAVESFIGWNKLIKSWEPDVILQAESAERNLPLFLQKRGYNTKPNCDIAKNNNSRPHPHLTLSQIKNEIQPSLFNELVEWANEYNYKLQ